MKKIFKCVLGLVLLFGTAMASEDYKPHNDKRLKYTMNSQEGEIPVLPDDIIAKIHTLPNDIRAKILSFINRAAISKTLENVRVESFCIKTGAEPNTYTVINKNNWEEYIAGKHEWSLKNLIIWGVGGKILKELIPKLTDITALWIESSEFQPDISNRNFPGREYTSFTTGISTLTNLEHLTLVDTRFAEGTKSIEARIVDNYVPEIRYLTKIKSLFIKNYYLSEAISKLAFEIKDLSCLTCLSLPNNAINPKSFKTILESGVNWSSLTSLDLGGNYLKSLDEEDLESIRCIPNLKYKDDKQDNDYTYVSRNIIQNICGKRMETFLDTLVKAVQDKNECEYPMGRSALKLFFDFEDIEWFIDEVAAKQIGNIISKKYSTIERINLHPERPKEIEKSWYKGEGNVLITRLFYNLYYDGGSQAPYIPCMGSSRLDSKGMDSSRDSMGNVALNMHYYSGKKNEVIYHFKLTTYNKELYSWPVAIG